MKSFIFLLFTIVFTSCQAQMNKDIFKPQNEETLKYIEEKQLEEKYEFAVFASGCFWCVEPIFDSIIGVADTISGYSGGHTDYVNYELSNTGKTGHAEAVKVYYDPSLVSFEQLVDVYYASHDFVQTNGQGNDRGPQYRSIAFYQSDAEKLVIELKIAEIEAQITEKVATEVLKFEKFFVAEDYHQDFKKRNPNHPYIQNISNKRYERFKENYKPNK